MFSNEPEREFQSISSVDSFDPNIQLGRILECKLCKKQYSDPVILPCFNTVCSKHVTDFKEIKGFNCTLCSQIHLIPSNGYPMNKEMVQLIAIFVNITKYNTKKLICHETLANFDSKQQIKQGFQNLNATIRLCDSFSNSSLGYISDQFKKIEDEVKAKKSYLIDTIEQHYREILNKLNHNRQRCSNDAALKAIHFKQVINSSKMKCEKWQEDFKKEGYSIDQYWKCVKYSQVFEINKLNYFFDKYRKALIRNSEFEFKFNLNEVKLGELVEKTFDFKKDDSNKTTRTIRMVIDNFKSFINTYEYRESVDYIEIKSVAWRIQVEIEKSEKYELGLGFYVRVDTDDLEFLKLKPIIAEITLKVIPCKSCQQGVSLSETFKEKFDKVNLGHGYKSFLTIRQIMEPCNGIYDALYDRITLEASIKLIDEPQSESNSKA